LNCEPLEKMERKKVLRECSDAGFLLNREMLEFFLGLSDEDFAKSLDLIKNSDFNEKILTKKVFNEKISKSLGVFFENSCNSVKILKDFDNNGKKIANSDFVDYFRRRFEVIRDLLLARGFDNLISIRRLGESNVVCSVIGMVYAKRITKNRNLLLEVEDLGGRVVILVNRDNRELFECGMRLKEDDILAFRCSGSAKMLFASEFIFPDSYKREEEFGNDDSWVGFLGDFHVGSRGFLEGELRRFVSWVNGEVGDERSREIARKLKCLVIVGDLVEGVGVYPGQERDLRIKSVRMQYDKLSEILIDLRDDVEVVVLPGLHDAVWLGQPQPGLDRKWVGKLADLKNLRFVSNPCVFEFGGLRFFVNYGVNRVDNLNDVLSRGVLPFVYGEGDFVPLDGEDLVLNDGVDIFVYGGSHRSGVCEVGGVLGVWTSCWVGKSDFDMRCGLDVDNSRVPILNLRSREVKVLDFGGNEVVWESGEDLVCDLNGECDNG
jgi:DNA polymerase II small subunit